MKEKGLKFKDKTGRYYQFGALAVSFLLVVTAVGIATVTFNEKGVTTDDGLIIAYDGIYANLTANITAKTGRSATIVVASSTSLESSKRNADYVCDGNNDQIEINDAIVKASVTGGTVLLMEGKYNISAEIDYDFNCWLIGSGNNWNSGGTQIYLDDNSDCDMIVIDGTDGGSHMFFPYIGNMYLYGNKDNQASGNGIFIDSDGDCSDLIIENVGIDKCKDDGVYIYYGWYMTLNRVWSEYNGEDGFHIKVNVRMTDCTAAFNEENGILAAGNHVDIINTHMTQNDNHGLWVSGANHYAYVVNCVINNNSYSVANNYDGVRVDAGAFVSILNTEIKGDNHDNWIRVPSWSTGSGFVSQCQFWGSSKMDEGIGDIIFTNNGGYEYNTLYPLYEQDAEPSLVDNTTAWWIDTNDANKLYLVANSYGNAVKVQLV